MKIWANCILHNEENFIWFAVMSVVDFVDKVLVYDTGSTDKTVEIIKEIQKIKKDKINFKEVGLVDKQEFTKMRQAMLDASECDWILVLDGDEIWWENSIKNIVKEINTIGMEIDGIVVPMIVPVGDIYHYREKETGQYKLLGKKGHFNLRAINKKIPGLHVDLPYGKEGYFDAVGKEIQKRKGITFLDAPYLHVTHLKRSNSVRKYNKFKIETGKSFSKDFKYPEVLFKPRPINCPDPFRKMSGLELMIAKFITPVKKIKRKFF